MENKLRLCRVCLKSEKNETFNSIFAESFKYAKLIFQLSSVVIEETDNEIPALMCNKCENNLLNIITIQEHCKKADNYIRSLCLEIKMLPKTIEVIEVYDDDDDDEAELTQIQNTVNQNYEIAKGSIHKDIKDISLNIKPLVGSKSVNRVQKTVQRKKKVKRLNCNMCKKSYHSNYALQQHLSVYHKGIDLCCRWCLKTFGSSTDLIRHTRTHTGERPFTCFYCPKTFNVSSNCLRHMRSFHNYII